MIYTSPSKYYQLKFPYPWKVEEQQNTISIYNEKDGYGAINITSYQIPEKYLFDTKQELIEFIKKEDIFHDNIQQVHLDNKDIAFIELVNSKRYWQYYVVYLNHKALFITYNCEFLNKNKEIKEVNYIMNSINFL